MKLNDPALLLTADELEDLGFDPEEQLAVAEYYDPKTLRKDGNTYRMTPKPLYANPYYLSE